MKQLLTEKEQQFWEKYTQWYFSRIKAPSVYDLARYTKKSPQLWQYYLTIFRKKGWIKDKKIKRSGEKTPKNQNI